MSLKGKKKAGRLGLHWLRIEHRAMEDLLWELLPACLQHLLCHRYRSCWFFLAFSLKISAETPPAPRCLRQMVRQMTSREASLQQAPCWCQKFKKASWGKENVQHHGLKLPGEDLCAGRTHRMVTGWSGDCGSVN